MNLLIKLIPLLLLIGFCAPSYAAVNDVEFNACAVYSAEDGDTKTEEGDTEEEEEPDCE